MPGVGGSLRLSAPLFAFAICATWRLHPLWPQWIAHTSRHHGGVPLRASDFSAFAVTPIGSSFVFINLQIPFPATPSFSHPYKTPGVSPCNEFLDRLISVLAACPNPIGCRRPPRPVGVARKRGGGLPELHNFGAVISPFRINTCKSVLKQRALTSFFDILGTEGAFFADKP